jgi:hypothetical protein
LPPDAAPNLGDGALLQSEQAPPDDGSAPTDDGAADASADVSGMGFGFGLDVWEHRASMY